MASVREITRKQRYSLKEKNSKKLPVELCTVNFECDQNLGFLVRAAACFGVSKINVIGSVPSKKLLNIYSGTLSDYVKIESFSNPRSYLKYAKEKNSKIISAEILDSSESIFSVDFSSFSNFHLVVGNETTGVPAEILTQSVHVRIPMPGVGYCLNTSQTANIFLYEISKQMLKDKTKNYS